MPHTPPSQRTSPAGRPAAPLDLRSSRLEPAGRATTVLLATQREVLSLGFGHVLAATTDLRLVGVVGSVDDACRAVAHGSVDVVVIDVHLDGAGGLDVNRRLAGIASSSRHCYLVDGVDARIMARLTRGGAGGFITTTASAAQMRDTLRHACQGAVVMDPVTARAVADDVLVLPACADGAALTERELQLLDLLGEGRTNREIADALYLSEKTVKNGLSGLFRKLGVRSRTEAALVSAGTAPVATGMARAA